MTPHRRKRGARRRRRFYPPPDLNKQPQRTESERDWRPELIAIVLARIADALVAGPDDMQILLRSATAMAKAIPPEKLSRRTHVERAAEELAQALDWMDRDFGFPPGHWKDFRRQIKAGLPHEHRDA